jgi:hypothetical protein
LFAVFPGFTQHWISVVWGNAYVLYAFVFFSLALTTWAVKNPRRLWYAIPLGLALSAFTLFSTEYFFGVELLRPVLAWFALSQGGLSPRARLKRAGLLWLPFFALMAVFAVWRGAFHPFGGGGQEGLLTALFSSPISLLLHLPQRILRDAFQTFVSAWGQAFAYGPLLENGGLVFALLAVLAGALFWLYLARLREPAHEQSDRNENWPQQAALLGLFAFLAVGPPLWLTRLPLTMAFPWDRFFLVFAPGASLFTAALVSWLVRGPARRALLLALLLGAAVGFQNANAAVFRKEWSDQRDFFWQLAWRAPAVQPGTLFLVDQVGFTYMEDDSLSGPLNWTLDPNANTNRMNYAVFNIPERLVALGYLVPGHPALKDFRAQSYSGSTSSAVVLRFNPPGCLQVLDPRRDALRANLPEFDQRALFLSRPELILPAPLPGQASSAPPLEIFGPEPKSKWCYYYEQAALALQNQDWERIRTLKQQSIGQGFFPADPAEYQPFIEGYLHLGQWDDAVDLTRRSYSASAANGPALCSLWRQARAWIPSNDNNSSYGRIWSETAVYLHCTE